MTYTFVLLLLIYTWPCSYIILGVEIKGDLSLLRFFCKFLIRNEYKQQINVLINSKFCSNLATSASAESNFDGLVLLYSCGKCWNFHYVDCKNQNKQDVFSDIDMIRAIKRIQCMILSVVFPINSPLHSYE